MEGAGGGVSIFLIQWSGYLELGMKNVLVTGFRYWEHRYPHNKRSHHMAPQHRNLPLGYHSKIEQFCRWTLLLTSIMRFEALTILISTFSAFGKVKSSLHCSFTSYSTRTFWTAQAQKCWHILLVLLIFPCWCLFKLLWKISAKTNDVS